MLDMIYKVACVATLFFMRCDMISSTTNKATDKNDWRIYAYRIECMNATYRNYQKDENGGNHYEEEFDRIGIYLRQKWIDERA